MYCQWQQEGESSKKQGRFCAWFVTNKRTKGERKKESQKFPDKQAPPHAVQSVQWADLVTSARGRGGIEGGRGGERESRRRRGSGALAVCGIGTLGGSWRGWGRLNHPWQWNAWLRRSEEKDGGEGGQDHRGRTVRMDNHTPKWLWRGAGPHDLQPASWVCESDHTSTLHVAYWIY